MVVNKCNCEQVSILENLPIMFHKDEGNSQVSGLRSPRQKGIIVMNKCLPMYNCPLVEYIYRYYRYDVYITSTDASGIGRMDDTQFNQPDGAVANCQSFGHRDTTSHKSGCTENQIFRNTEHWIECVQSR